MITLINPELFNLTTTKETDNKGNEYFKTMISSSVEVLNKKTNEKINRTITSIQSETEDYNETNMGVRTIKTKNGRTRVSIHSNSSNKYDTNAFLVAVPFNGFIGEITKSFQYRIYKGLILRAEKRTIEFNGETYKKIAYMIVVPNESLFKDDHKYHTDEVKMVIPTFNLETDKLGINHTIKSTVELTFKKDGECIYEVFKEEVDPIDTEDFKNKTIFPIYMPVNRKETRNKTGNTKSSYRESNSKKDNNFDRMIEDFNRSSNEKQRDFNKKNNKRK